MMMLSFHSTFALGLIALAFGTAILIWAKVHVAPLAKFIGYIIVILTALNLACIGYYGVKSWNEGCYNMPPCPMMKQMQMMQGQMMAKPMMQGQMMPNKPMMQKATNNKNNKK